MASNTDSAATALVQGPPAPDAETLARWQEGQRRGRMLDGLWEEDLKASMRREFAADRLKLQGPVDLSSNLFRSVIGQLSVMYDQVPTIEHVDPVAVEIMEQVTNSAGMWQLAQTLQQQTLALREGAYRFDVTDAKGLLVRIVPAYLLDAVADPDQPDVPVTVYEYRLREKADGDTIWTRDCLSIADPSAPVFRVESASGKEDLSAEYLGGAFSGDAYPYRRTDGTPYLPFSLYHAIRTGKMWDAHRGKELVDGTLAVAGLKTMWKHTVKDCSHPQRYAINAKLSGDSVGFVMTDPATMVHFEPKMPGQPSSVGQFDPGGDAKTLGEAIREYSADFAAEFDLAPADIKRTHTDARSGHAIEVSRSGQRSAQKRFEPQFQRADSVSLSVIASLLNDALGLGLPETGWAVRYKGIPLSIEEKKLLMEDHKMRAELGVTSKPHLLAQLEGVTKDQARAMLDEFDRDNARFSTVGNVPTPTNIITAPSE